MCDDMFQILVRVVPALCNIISRTPTRLTSGPPIIPPIIPPIC
jgi:hypothetical protein